MYTVVALRAKSAIATVIIITYKKEQYHGDEEEDGFINEEGLNEEH